jgi:hypothetical protein
MSGTIVDVTSAATITADKWRLRGIRFSPAAASAVVDVTDTDGNSIFSVVAPDVGNVVKEYGGNGFDVDGVIVTSITASSVVTFEIL